MSLELRCLIQGSPIGVDPSPNAVAPHPSRIFRTPMRQGSRTSGPVQVLGTLADGTSCSFTVWARVDQLSAWFKVGDTRPVTALVVGVVGNVPPDAEVFVQLTDLIGAPTRFGIFAGFSSLDDPIWSRSDNDITPAAAGDDVNLGSGLTTITDVNHVGATKVGGVVYKDHTAPNPYTVGAHDSQVNTKTTGGVLECQLPDAVANDGRGILFVDWDRTWDASAVTLSCVVGGQLVDGAATLVLNVKGGTCYVFAGEGGWKSLPKF